ncbi:DUF6792 domain-containing protein [Gracilibacillus saliphilus]|uniref:DUF6792 domain-containing protein n=1 Tax=Gracilibacillus saliphilus TaxID=543890 RepID=UPI0013D503D1|nr:DUF6792 domain-containing protein [Gracilibacillus saliphilus]
MLNKELFDSELIRARIMELEYNDLDPVEIENEVKRIYLEEHGEELVAEISVYKSDEILKEIRERGRDSGFDGTIIHLKNGEDKINQVITIARGSELSEGANWRPLDWSYNGNGSLVGVTTDQYEEANRFHQNVMEKITPITDSDLPDLKKYGYGHSLGGGLIVTLQMMTEDFDTVYSINGAPPSFYQLAEIDQKFYTSLNKKYNIQGEIDIYSLPPSEVKAFTEDYYKNKIDETTIQHTTVEEDMLYSITRTRGFIDIGERDGFLSYHEEYGNFEALMRQVPDEVVQSIQEVLLPYAQTYNKKGFDAFVKELTGFNPKTVDSFLAARDELNQMLVNNAEWQKETMDSIEKISQGSFWSRVKESAKFVYRTPANLKSIVSQNINSNIKIATQASQVMVTGVPMLVDMATRIPSVLKQVKQIRQHLPEITNAFVDAELMTEEEQQLILSSTQQIETDLIVINEQVSKLQNFSFLYPPRTTLALTTALNINDIYQHVLPRARNIQTTFERLRDVDWTFVDYFQQSVHAHSLDAVIETLSREDTSESQHPLLMRFKNPQEVFDFALQNLTNMKGHPLRLALSRKRGSRIVIQIEAALRIYKEGLAILEEKRAVVRQLKHLYQEEFEEDYARKRQYIMRRIHNMESSPYSYQYLINHLSRTGYQIKIRGINVHEHLPPLPKSFSEDFYDTINQLERELSQEQQLIADIKDAIEAFFEKEFQIANAIY